MSTIVFSPELRQVQNLIRERAGVPPLPDPDTQLHCQTCGKWKDDEAFYRQDKERYGERRGRRFSCKKCDNDRRKQWRLKNPEQSKEIDKKRKLRDRRRRNQGREGLVSCACGEEMHPMGMGSHRRACRAWLDSQQNV